MITTRKLTCIALVIGASALQALAGPGPQSLNTPLNTREQASALKPGTPVAMSCAKCKTVMINTDRKGILAWFTPKTKHACPGCGGYLKVDTYAVKGIRPAQYMHTCTKCGANSAFCCTSGHTEGM